MGRSDTRSRSRCSIPMAPPARHREKARKLYLPPVQRMVSEHADAREKLEDWRRDYNEVRPHSAIGYNVPIDLHNPGGATSPSP
ncbi:integrase core domain-containing protein [Amorphus sp. MBR-141]